MSTPVKIVAIFNAHAGKTADLRALLDTMLEPSRAEPGNLRYDLWQDREDPDRFVLDELYVDAEAVDTHRGTAHFQAFAATIGDVADRTAILLDPAAIA